MSEPTEDSPALRRALSGASVIVRDRTRGVALAFFGGMVVRGYDRDGNQVAYWQLPTWTTGESYPSTARNEMERAAATGKYPGGIKQG